MTAGCGLESHPKPCVDMYRRASTRTGHPCNGCETGRKRTALDVPCETAQPEKKEAMVDQEKVKENVLRVLERKGRMTISNLKLFAGNKETREDFRAAVDALAGEGKVVTKEGAREGSLSVSLPGAAAVSNDATITSKNPRSVNRSSATPPIKTRAKLERPVPAPRKSTANVAGIVNIDHMISFLEEKRVAIDTAIAGLRALA